MNTLHQQAAAFRARHVPGRPLVLANAWDIASARVIEEAGAPALATTSAGLSWDHGTADGERLGSKRASAAVERIARAVRIPVSADIETGYADDAEGVAGTVRAVLGAGAAGINIEDALYGGPTALRPVAEQCERIAAARAAADTAGVPLFINARTDTYLRQAGDLADTLERAAAYLAAGADGIFVPGPTDPPTVAALAAGIDGPLNILAGPGAPPVAELAAVGVARISTGSSIAEAAHALVRRAVRELLGTGTYESLAGGYDYGTLNQLLGGRG